MPHPRPSRRRAALAVSAAALVPFLGLPGGAAADVAATAVETPLPDAVVEFTSRDPDDYIVRIAGSTTGGSVGDEVDLVCIVRVVGQRSVTSVARNVPLDADGRFSVDAAVPSLPCRIHAVPAGFSVETDAPPSDDSDLAAFTGPRVLFGVFASLTDDDAPGAESYLSYRTQRRGVALTGGLLQAADGADVDLGGQGAAGVQQAFALEDTTLRPLVGGAGILLPSGGESAADPQTAQLEVDGAAAHVAARSGAEHVRVVSERLDPVSGDLETVESAPVARVLAADADGATLAPSGLVLERTVRQDHDGRVFTFHDTFRSTDGAAHRVEARYAQSPVLSGNDIGYRVPWATGDAFVPPTRGRTFGPSPSTPAVVDAHVGPLRGPDGDDLPSTGGEVAFAYDTPVSQVTVIYPGGLLTQIVRDVPAGGASTIAQRVVQAVTPAERDELVRDTTPAPPVEPDPAPVPASLGPISVPLPPVGRTPALPLADPTPALRAAVRQALRSRGQAGRLRGRRAVTVRVPGAPAGRYAVTVRRSSTRGPRVAVAAGTLSADGTATLRLRSTAAARRWLASSAGRRVRAVRAFVTVSWTPVGGSPRTRSGTAVLRVR